MKHLSLTKEQAALYTELLKNSGYSANMKQQNISFSKGYGDKTYMSHSLNVIRATKKTGGEKITKKIFGEPNGKASDSQDRRYSTWFFNGYSGKAGSKVY